jgi:threonine/homoserine/homoserine lactone efflux protein
MTLSTWLGLLAICCLGAMSPGPSLAMVVRHTLSGGRLHGVVCAWAHSIGIGVYALVTLLGLAAVLKASPILFNAIAVIGAAYLAWMGIQALGSTGAMQQKLAAGKPTSLWIAARDGIASQFVLAAQTFTGQGLIVFTPLIVDGLWYTIIAFVLSHSAVLPKLREKTKLIDRLSGIVLILLSIRVIYTLL